MTDPEGEVVTTQYNEQLWRTKVTQQTAGDDVITEYVYDPDGRVVTYRAKNSTTGDQETLYTYDLDGLKVTTQWPDSGTTVQTYDLAGQRLTTIDPIGTSVMRSYDTDRRLTAIDISKATNVLGISAIDYGYDALGRITSADTTDPTVTTVVERTYNTLGKIQTEKQVIDGWNSGNGRTITYDWNEAGQKTGVTYPVSGDVITYTRDDLDRVDKVSRGSDEVVDYTFSGARVIGKAFPGSLVEQTYDYFGRLTKIHHEDTSSGNPLVELNYGYNDAHQITSMDKLFYDDVQNTRITAETEDLGDQYAYDGAGRLVTVLRGVPTAEIDTAMGTNITNNDYDELVEYDYDQVGNRVTFAIDGTDQVTYAHNVVNEMTTENGTTHSYDANGNLEGVSNAYKYDFNNQLNWHDDGSFEYRWHYDAFGRRVQRDKISGIVISQRNYWDGDQLVEKVAFSAAGPSETLNKEFVFGPQIDELLLHINPTPNPDVLHYAHTDHLGSVMALVDDTGAIQESYRYTEWGVPTILDGSFTRQSPGSTPPSGNAFMYTGRGYSNDAAGSGEIWYDYRARHYRADAGRFVQRDPAGYGDGAGLYGYADGHPLYATDPMGTTCQLVTAPPSGEPPPSEKSGAVANDADCEGLLQPVQSDSDGSDTECGAGHLNAHMNSATCDSIAHPETSVQNAGLNGAYACSGGACASTQQSNSATPPSTAPAASTPFGFGGPQSGYSHTFSFAPGTPRSHDTSARVGVGPGMTDGESVSFTICWCSGPGGESCLCIFFLLKCSCN